MFKVFETFLNGQTVFRYVLKRVRNTLKQCSKSGQPGFTRESTRGQPGFTRESARGQPGFNQGSLVYFHTTIFS